MTKSNSFAAGKALIASALIVASCLVALPACAQSSMASPGDCPQVEGVIVECVRASATDSRIQRFDGPNYVLVAPQAKASGQLLLFLSGTGGQPTGGRAFLAAAAVAGYRVISLAYNDDLSVAVYCPAKPSASCSSTFRAMRIWGDQTLGDAAVDNSAAESIVNRLVRLLQYLDRTHPEAGWGGYLENGVPAWPQIAVAGQSQGAGMAAFLAKQQLLARVILFSSPWDFVARNGQRQLAPWIALPNRTPPGRWFGGYHARENQADLLAKSYAALKIPQDHVRVFNEDLPPGVSPQSGNPFHGQGLFNPAYADARDFFLRTPLR